jgi:hypothetical protein
MADTIITNFKNMKKLNLIFILALSFILMGCDATFSDDPAREIERNIGGTITKPYTFSSGGVIRSSEMNSNFDTIYTLVNGNLNNANIVASADIDADKIEGIAVVLTPAVSSQTINSAINLNGALYISTTTGAFGLPTLTATQRDALSPSAGWQHWNSSSSTVQYYDGSNWIEFSSGAPAYTAGDGIDLTGSTFSVDVVTSNGLEFSGGQLTVSTSSSIILEGGNLAVSTSTNYNWTGTHTFTGASTTIEDLTVNANATTTGNQVISGNLSVTDGQTATLPSIVFFGSTSTANLLNGGDADALHNHNTQLGYYVGVGVFAPKTWYNFDLDFNADWWTLVNTSFSQNGGSWAEFAVTANADSAITSVNISINDVGQGLDFDDDKDVIAEFALRVDSIGNNQMGWGLSNTVAPFADFDDTSVDAACFTVGADGKLYAHTSNAGVGGTETEITGITLTNVNTYRIEFNAGTNALFYVNGVLETTVTTTLPDGATDIKFGFGGAANNPGDGIQYVTKPNFSVQK